MPYLPFGACSGWLIGSFDLILVFAFLVFSRSFQSGVDKISAKGDIVSVLGLWDTHSQLQLLKFVVE